MPRSNVFYRTLFEHGTALIKLNSMTALWVRIVLNVFPGLLKVNGRWVLIGDGIKVAKQGKKMPGVKLLHQDSDSNTKAEYIMGVRHEVA